MRRENMYSWQRSFCKSCRNFIQSIISTAARINHLCVCPAGFGHVTRNTRPLQRRSPEKGRRAHKHTQHSKQQRDFSLSLSLFLANCFLNETKTRIFMLFRFVFFNLRITASGAIVGKFSRPFGITQNSEFPSFNAAKR